MNVNTNKEFKDIAPRWDKKFGQGLAKALINSVIDGEPLNITSWHLCAVGEAYHFSNKYHLTTGKEYCEECEYFGFKFANLAYNANIFDGCDDKDSNDDFRYMKENLHKLKQDFAKHWNERHV